MNDLADFLQPTAVLVGVRRAIRDLVGSQGLGQLAKIMFSQVNRRVLMAMRVSCIVSLRSSMMVRGRGQLTPTRSLLPVLFTGQVFFAVCIHVNFRGRDAAARNLRNLKTRPDLE